MRIAHQALRLLLVACCALFLLGSNPANPKADRVSAELVFDNVAGSESDATPVTLQGGASVPNTAVLHGYRIVRYGGTDGSLTVTVRLYESESGGDTILFELAHTIAANNDLGLKTGIDLPLNTPAYGGLYVSVEDDGADTDYKVHVYLRSDR